MGDLHGERGVARPHLRLLAAWTVVSLSLLFLAVYGGCNWITSQRTDVGTWYFNWERYIPFVPIMIVPYMSIDLFFLAAPFLCSDEGELRILARRIRLAILAAGGCFLLMPLRFAFERPGAEGWLGVIFGTFQSMDRPYNLFPSLHITLRTILAELYARHSRGIVRGALSVWFSLIGFSTVLTYQHHVIDVVGGFVLAGSCFYLIGEPSARLPMVPNRRVGWYYGFGTVALLGLAAITWPWGSVLWWPGVALGLLTAGYWGMGPGIFRKKGGQLPFSSRLVLAPLLLGHHVSWLYYRQQCRAWDEVTPRVWVGRVLTNREAAEAIRRGVSSVLDLTAEFSEATPFLTQPYLNLAILDLTAPTQDQLRQAVSFIDEGTSKGTVYVHCKAGYSRSAAVVGAYLLASGKAETVEEAINLLRNARPSMVFRPEVWQALRAFQQAEVKP